MPNAVHRLRIWHGDATRAIPPACKRSSSLSWPGRRQHRVQLAVFDRAAGALPSLAHPRPPAIGARRFEDLNFYETEAKLDAYEEDFSVARSVAPALLCESALSRTFNPASMRRQSIR